MRRSKRPSTATTTLNTRRWKGRPMARARRTPPSRRHQRERRGNVLGIAFVIFAFLAILAGGGTVAWFSMGRVELDEVFCPVDGPVSVTAVLVDQTDRFSA